MKTYLLVLTAVMVFGIAQATVPAPPRLTARGPHHVGVRTLDLTDKGRGRTLKVEIWYPTDAVEKTTFYDAMLGPTAVRLSGRATRNARPTKAKVPLILVSHGQPGTRYQLAYLSEHLASYGFVVASLEHAGSTYQDTTDADYVTSLIYRPEDILFAIDALPKVISNADTTNVGLVGYSYGGYSVLNTAGIPLDGDAFAAFCSETNDAPPCFALPAFNDLEAKRGASIETDPRIKALFVMAPYGEPWLGAASLAKLNVPFFVAAGSSDEVAVYAQNALEYFRQAGSEDKYLLTLGGAEHNPYAECPESVRGIEDCFDPVWSQPRAHALIEHFATAFFGRFLQGNHADGRYLEPDMPGVEQDTMPKLTLEMGR